MKKILNNALMLYILTFSNYILYFLTIPYQARVLGPELFGVVGFATALGLYFQLLISFGFTMSATADVAKCRSSNGDIHQIPFIFSKVFYSQIILTFISLLILIFLVSFVDILRQHALLFYITFASVSIAALMPDYIYRGTENMKAITLRSVIARVIFTVLLFIFMKQPNDYYMVPLFSALGGGVILLAVFFDLRKKGLMSFQFPGVRQVLKTVQASSMFFWSRISTNIYGATNTFIVGLLYGPASITTGMFTVADKIMVAAKQAITPIVDAIYPNAVKNRSLKLIKRSLFIITPVLIVGCAIAWILAYDLTTFVFGPDFREAGHYIRILLPVVPITFIGLIIGFPALTVIDKVKHANLSVIVASIFHLLALVLLYITGSLTAELICYITVFTNLITLVYRATILIRYRARRSHT